MCLPSRKNSGASTVIQWIDSYNSHHSSVRWVRLFSLIDKQGNWEPRGRRRNWVPPCLLNSPTFNHWAAHSRWALTPSEEFPRQEYVLSWFALPLRQNVHFLPISPPVQYDSPFFSFPYQVLPLLSCAFSLHDPTRHGLPQVSPPWWSFFQFCRPLHTLRGPTAPSSLGSYILS